MTRVQLDQQVEAAVTHIFPFGVFARLDDGTPAGMPAYIRRRELDLDADADPQQVVSVGQRIQAIVIAMGEPGKRTELSRRATLADPWIDFTHKFSEGDILCGSVQALNPSGAFVHVSAGINGFVPLSDFASWEVTRPEELLWVGDQVETIITQISARSRRLSLSIKMRMEQRDRAISVLERMAGHAPGSTRPAAVHVPEKDSSRLDPSTAAKLGPILVVDDHQEMNHSLSTWLRRRGFTVHQASSSVEAVDQAQRCNPRFILLDLNLPDGDGLQLVQLLREITGQSSICLMSSPDSLFERAEEIEAARITHIFPKPLDLEEIESVLLHAARGESSSAWHKLPSLSPGEMPVFKSFESFEDTQILPGTRLKRALDQVNTEVKAETALLFHLDPGSGAVSILAQSGDQALNQAALYTLHESPVKDVIQENTSVYVTEVTGKVEARFQKLRDLLPFESCLGVPVQVQEEVRHAAFFFHSKPEAFTRYRLRDAQAGALLFAALLEEEALNRRIQLMNPILLSGQLATGFGHEVFNKISALELQILDLQSLQSRSDQFQAALLRLTDLTLDLKKTTEGFQQLMWTQDPQATFDVNEVVERAIALVDPIARKERTRMITRLAPGLPKGHGNAIALQQVFLNVILNAIQQMALKSQQHRWNGQRFLEISTTLNETGSRLQIRFVDTGPGIHHQLWKKIFRPGFSTRGGSGLGLYLARSFMQSLRGGLRVEESIMGMGTTFLVELLVTR